MNDSIDVGLEGRLRSMMRDVLDPETGPHPQWTSSPAATRVAAGEGARRWWPSSNLRLLAIAAVLAVGGATAAGAALRLLPSTNTNDPAANGWVAFEDDGDVILGLFDGEASAIVMGGPGRQFCPQFLGNRLLAIADYQALATTWQISVSTIGTDGRATAPSYKVPIGVLSNDNDECFEGSLDGRRFAFLAREDPETRIAALHVVSAGGSIQEVVLPPDDRFLQFFDFAWSPDGTKLAVVRVLQEAAPLIAYSSEIWVVNVSAAQSTRALLSGRDELITNIAWSMDGTRIGLRGTFMEWTQKNGEQRGDSHGSFVRVIDAYASDGVPIEIDALRNPEINAGANAAWSPDGAQLAWILDGELRVGGADGRGWRALQPVSSDELGLGWATGPVIWSPDGKHIMVGQLDTPEPDPEAQYSVVVYELASDGQPVPFLNWRDVDPGRISWQAVRE